MTGVRVLVTDHSFDDLSEERAILAQSGVELVTAACTTEDDVIAAVTEGVSVLLVQWAPIGRRVLESCPDVRLVVRYGIGLDNIDLEAAARLGVGVAHVPDYCLEEVAEHTVALMLAVQRRLGEFDGLVRTGLWTDTTHGPGPRVPLSRQTIGIVGFGRIGQRVGALLRAFATTVRVYDPLASPAIIAAAGFEAVDSLAELAGCDVVTLHCPLTSSTRGLVDQSFLSALNEGAILLNTSRGPLVNMNALVAALRSGHLGGAGLDTFDREPLPVDHPLLACWNVLVTPHIAWLSDAARRTLQRETALEAARFLAGLPLRCAAVARTR